MVAEGYKETEIGVIPEDWEVVKLKEVITNTQLGVNVKASLDTDGIKLLKMGNLTRGGFNFNKLEKTNDEIENIGNYYLKYGDFLFNTRNTPHLVGKSSVWKWNNKDVIFNSNIMRISFSKNINTFFYNNYFASDVGWRALKKISKGTTSVGAIYTKDLITVKIPLLSLKEQEKIADILSTIDEKIDVINSQIQKAETLKKGLLQKLLSEGIGYSEFKDSELGKIPESWEIAKLKDTGLTIIDGDRGNNYPKSDDFTDEGYCLFLSAKNITKNGFRLNVKQFISEEKDNLLRKGKLKDLDIIITTRGSVGHIAFNKNIKYQNMRINSGMVILRNSDDKINQNYVYKLFASNVIQGQVEKIAFGSAQPQLTVKEINNLKIPLPPLQEQKQIADILSTADEKLEVLRAKKEKYETLKKGLLQKLLSGEVRV